MKPPAAGSLLPARGYRPRRLLIMAMSHKFSSDRDLLNHDASPRAGEHSLWAKTQQQEAAFRREGQDSIAEVRRSVVLADDIRPTCAVDRDAVNPFGGRSAGVVNATCTE